MGTANNPTEVVEKVKILPFIFQVLFLATAFCGKTSSQSVLQKMPQSTHDSGLQKLAVSFSEASKQTSSLSKICLDLLWGQN